MKPLPDHRAPQIVWKFFKARKSENVGGFWQPIGDFPAKEFPEAAWDHVETLRRKKTGTRRFFRRPRSVSVRDCGVCLP
jgi:hypothetical protein